MHTVIGSADGRFGGWRGHFRFWCGGERHSAVLAEPRTLSHSSAGQQWKTFGAFSTRGGVLNAEAELPE